MVYHLNYATYNYLAYQNVLSACVAEITHLDFVTWSFLRQCNMKWKQKMQTKAEEVLNSLKIQSCSSVTHNGLMKLSTDQLAYLLNSFVNIFYRDLIVCKAVVAETS